MQLDITENIPADFLNSQPREIRKYFPNPTLLKISGKSTKTLFLSILLHGNETSSFRVLKNILCTVKDSPPNKSLLIFIGNVFACEQGVRRLDHQLDFNRIWKSGDSEEERLAHKVKEQLLNSDLFAAIDIHNNTGKNPLYSCVTDTNRKDLYLASLFSQNIVYFENPDTVLTKFTGKLCPSVVLECGQPENVLGIEKSTQYIFDLLRLPTLETHIDPTLSANVYKTIGRILVTENFSLSFDSITPPQLQLREQLSNYNFTTLNAGFEIARIHQSKSIPLRVYGDSNQDLTDDFLFLENSSIKLKKTVIPAMLTEDTTIIKNDCLGYLMSPVNL